ncbi:hypothetical protein, partial [Acinetobacter baumannii]|uniref:hypothetical protein n=1 Tax=Acinetobacter baumannii TaxID=470 RepID=UPI001113D8F8
MLRIVPKDEVQLSLIKDLEEMMEFELVFRRGLTTVSNPVDVRVPSHVLNSVKDYLETQNIEYSTMIEDLQMLLDMEQKVMAGARAPQPQNTDSFDF